MRIQDIINIIEEWAPPEIAWEKDNVGLQIGSRAGNVQRLLLALEISSEVVAEARRKKVDLIITHHPLLFRPLSSVSTSDNVGKLTYELIQSGIAVYTAHTNLDFTRGGVSFALAERLGLMDVDFLHRTGSGLKKVSVFVPQEHVESVAEAMGRAGAGIIGDYEMCSFRVSGTGTFRPRKGAKPFVGSVGKFEKVEEARLEMLAPSWRVPRVLSAMLNAHPYEEVAYDIYPLDNRPEDVGAGAIGDLAAPTSLRTFLDRVTKKLGTKHLRYTGDPRVRVKRVAVCGGGGTSLLPVAITAEADAFVTADIKYHTFHDAKGRIALIDAGHYETERPVLDVLVLRLQESLREKEEKVSVMITSNTTNPTLYH